MSMLHKAFAFDYARFAAELKPILAAALRADDSSALVQFIDSNLDDLCHPDEGDELGRDWRDRIEQGDVQEYGDFALTKYYDPNDDIGLDHEWEELQDLLVTSDEARVSPILGTVLGEGDVLFDPGRMGSYFQSEHSVRENLVYLQSLADRVSSDAMQAALGMLDAAAADDKGLYVVF